MHIGYLWWFVIPVVIGYLLLRRNPHMLNQAFAGAQQAWQQARPATGTTSGGDNILTRNWKAGVLILLAYVVLAGFSVIPWEPWHWLPQWSNPTLQGVADLVHEFWVAIILCWGVLAALVAYKGGKATKSLQKLLGVVVATLFIGIPVLNWAAKETGYYDCTSDAPCSSSAQGTEQATAMMAVPAGKSVCYDRDVVSHPLDYGYTTWYRGKECNAKDAAAGVCSQGTLDHFAFAPPRADTPVPQHWFVAQGAPYC